MTREASYGQSCFRTQLSLQIPWPTLGRSCINMNIYTSGNFCSHLVPSGSICAHLEAPTRHPGGIQGAPRRHPGSTQEAPRRHPGGTQKRPEGTQRHPGGSQGPRAVFDEKCAKTIVFYSKNDASDHFRVDGSDVTLTKSAACAQK